MISEMANALEAAALADPGEWHGDSRLSKPRLTDAVRDEIEAYFRANGFEVARQMSASGMIRRWLFIRKTL